MKKVKVIMKEWECKEVEYICEVSESVSAGQRWDAYGIGYLDDSDLGTDAEGFNAVPISSRTIDKDADSKWELVEWEEIKRLNNA
jgi:hypothetical protein